MRVDSAGGHLRRDVRHALVIEDEELAAARHVADDALADERVDEVAAPAPELEVGPDRHPATGVGRRAPTSPAARSVGVTLDVVADRVLRHADLPHEPDVDPRLLLDLANGRLGDGLALLDAAARARRPCTRASPGTSKTSSSSAPVSGCSRVT